MSRRSKTIPVLVLGGHSMDSGGQLYYCICSKRQRLDILLIVDDVSLLANLVLQRNL